VQPVRGADLADLDRLRFEQEYLLSLVARDVLNANDRSYEQRLAATKMVLGEADPTPTVLGLLVIGRSPEHWIPGAYTQFLCFGGNDLTAAVIDEEAIYGTISDQIRRVEEKFSAHNLRGVRFTDVVVEERRDAYPLDALRQLVRNAYMHRSYEATHSPVKVYWFDDRIEIHNPGGPFGSVTPENFGQPGITDYRNSRLPAAYRESVLGLEAAAGHQYEISRIKHYRSRMPMAMEARKPMFSLTSADGAIGAHQKNVGQCHEDFARLTTSIAKHAVEKQN